MDTTSSGQYAERRVARHLTSIGYKILDQNWRNRWCEIDIVAKKNNTVSFIEVKYRRNEAYGDGFDAITSDKLQRMSRAAEAWVLKENWNGDYCLGVARVTDEEVEIRLID